MSTTAPTPYPLPLSDTHRTELISKGISLEIAAEEGVQSVLSIDDLPEAFHYMAAITDADNPGAWRGPRNSSAAFRTGLLYWWDPAVIRLDERGEPIRIPQIKFDHSPWAYDADGEPTMKTTPDGQSLHQVKKYLYPKGQHPGVWVSQRMRRRIGKTKNLVIVEGTKQYLTVCTALDEESDYLVVGVAGCHNWSSNGIPLPDLGFVAEGTSRVFVIFDGDALGEKANPNVFNAAKALDKHLVALTGDRGWYVEVPTGGHVDPITGSKDNGVDDWLGGAFTTTESRRNALINVLSNRSVTKHLPTKFPGKRVSAQLAVPGPSGNDDVPTIDLVNEQVKMPDVLIPTANGVFRQPGKVLANFGPRIVRKYVSGDLHNSSEADVFYDIEVTQSGKVYSLTSVPASMLDRLASFNTLLRQAGLSSPKWLATEQNRAAIVGAMHYDAAANVSEGAGMVHTGWWDHPALGPVFLMPTGSVTSDGFTDEVKTFFEKGSKRSRYTFASLEGASEDEIREAVRKVNSVLTDCLGPGSAKTVFYLCVGQIAIGQSALAPKGTVYIYGMGSSGKTALQECFMSFYGRGIEPEVVINQTGKNITNIGRGLSHVVTGLDDVKRHPDDPDRERAVFSGLRDNVRRGYDGGKAGAGSMVKSETAANGWAPGSPDATDPIFIGTGELVPPSLDTTSRQRMLIWNHLSEHLVNGRAMEAITRSGIATLANAAFVRQIARWIADAGGMDAWVDSLESQRQKYVNDWVGEFGAIKRCAEVPAGRVLGWGLWARFCAEIGAWTETEAAEWTKAGATAIYDAGQTHYKTYCAVIEEEGRDLIDAIEGVLMNPNYYLKDRGTEGPNDEYDRRIPLGTRHTARASDTDPDEKAPRYVCVHPEMLRHALHKPAAEIMRALKQVAEPRIKRDGTKCYTRPVKWTDGRGLNAVTRQKDFYWIPEKVWLGRTEDESAGEPEGVTLAGLPTVIQTEAA